MRSSYGRPTSRWCRTPLCRRGRCFAQRAVDAPKRRLCSETFAQIQLFKTAFAATLRYTTWLAACNGIGPSAIACVPSPYCYAHRRRPSTRTISQGVNVCDGTGRDYVRSSSGTRHGSREASAFGHSTQLSHRSRSRSSRSRCRSRRCGRREQGAQSGDHDHDNNYERWSGPRDDASRVTRYRQREVRPHCR
jgi:hypothetical protein